MSTLLEVKLWIFGTVITVLVAVIVALGKFLARFLGKKFDEIVTELKAVSKASADTGYQLHDHNRRLDEHSETLKDHSSRLKQLESSPHRITLTNPPQQA